ncbi:MULTISPECIES: hypothetical protein [Amycolatopsis]|uniref:Uncharacterized protein n=1 Tax=Amycolatopsis albidoflavus TaxID=102226 RepID=A0ABW5HW98_9PSEU
MQACVSQLPPARDSDDRVFTTSHAVIQLDGASAFVPVPVPPARYADELGGSLRDRLEREPGSELPTVLADAIADVAHRLELRPGRSPSSTVTILREHADWIDILVLGDNLVVLPRTVLTDDRLSTLDLAPSRRYRQRLAEGSGFDDTHSTILRELQTQQAVRRNRPGGYWIAETDPDAAHHAVVHRCPADDVPWAVLATDGAYKPIRHLGLDDWPRLAAMDEDAIHRILARCEDWERHSDPAAQELPRAKRHDDKSLVVLRRSGAPSSTA